MTTNYKIGGIDVDAGNQYITKSYLIDVYPNLVPWMRTTGLWVCGYNGGSLGDNTQTHKSSPVQTVAGGTNWKQVSSGAGQNGGIKTDGTLWLWGYGVGGGLGDNSIISKSSPVQTIAGGTNWKQIACQNGYVTAIKVDGTLWSWGRNYGGELGDNTIIHRSSPVQTIAGGTNWKQIASGHPGIPAAIKTDGTLWLWGTNGAGQLGNNSIIDRSSPVQTVAGGTNWKSVSTGAANWAAIKTDGTLWTCGYNFYGQLGDNTTTNKSSPIQTIAGGTNWKQVSCGWTHTVAIKTDGTLWTWGQDNYGQLGDNSTVDKSSPIQTVAGGTIWKQVSGGDVMSGAIKTDGTLWVWGSDSYGRLGDNTMIHKSSPVQTIAGGTNWKQVSMGGILMAIRDVDSNA
jgi:alpha-tubulin suppressor-like RCC1 family protein